MLVVLETFSTKKMSLKKCFFKNYINILFFFPAGLLLQASKANASGGPMNDEAIGVIPAQTQLSTSLSLNLGMAGKTVSVFSNWS